MMTRANALLASIKACVMRMVDEKLEFLLVPCMILSLPRKADACGTYTIQGSFAGHAASPLMVQIQ
jgi:hypothetical protein